MKKYLLLMALLAMFSFRSFAQAEAYPVPDINQCGSEVFDLTVQTPITLGNQSTDQFTVTYFLSWQDAEENMNPIANPTAFMINTGNIEQALYIRVTNTSDGSFDVTSFVVGHWGGPQAPEMQDVVVCENYTLPALEAGMYYTQPGGSGTMIPAGTMITNSQIIFIYVSNGMCSSESSFTVTLGATPPIMFDPITGCNVGGSGNGIFNLEPYINIVYMSFPQVVSVTVHETVIDAQSGTNQVPNINNYMTVVPDQAICYFRVMSGEGCVSIVEVPLITVECTDNNISGHVAYDADGNGCDENDSPTAGVMVYYNSGNYTNYAYTDNEGNYTFHNVPAGDIYVYVNTFYPNNMISSPESHMVEMDEEDIEGVNFCLAPPAPVNDVAVYISPLNGAQPGFTATYALVVNNYGNTTANGTITLQFNDTQLDYVSSWPSTMALSGNTLTVPYSGLQPYGYQVIYLNFTVMPGVVNLGDIITFTANVTFDGGTDAYPTNNTDVLDQVSVNSWDPNDINVREGEQITEAQADGYLHYVIRFQNTGNANAHNVQVITTLDNNLDWSTFQPLIASHDFQTNRGGEGDEVTFRFNNIELAGEMVNEPESHGFVTYKIKPITNVAVGDSMSGQASIYFDFNPAINTNVITTTVMSAAGVNDINSNGFVMYPNPATSKVTLQMNDSTANTVAVTITDVLGKTVSKAALQGTQGDVDVSSLKSGVYFITLNAGNKLATKKLVIE